MKNIDISVGILTMHRVINYGSFLQAYATQEIIKSLGFNCEIIDYMFPNKWHYDNGLHNYKNIKSIISDYIYRLGMLKSHRKRKEINIAINILIFLIIIRHQMTLPKTLQYMIYT